MRHNMLDSRNWLAILTRTVNNREDSGGIRYTDDLGWVWWVQVPQDGWLPLDNSVVPTFPDPIALRRSA